MEDVDTALELEARIYFKKKFEDERYFIEVNGNFYRCSPATIIPCDGIPLDEVRTYSEQQLFSFKTTSEKGIVPAELHDVAERIIKELNLRVTKAKNDSKIHARGAGAGTTLEESTKSGSAECLIFKLLNVHREGINTNLRDSRFKLDADNHLLINDKNHKVVFDTEGGTRSDLFTDLDDANLPENLAQMQIAVVKTLQALFRETGKTYPTSVTDLFLIQEGLTEDQKQKVAKNISPRYKEILKAALLKPEFNDIRHLITIEHEPILDKKREAASGETLASSEKKHKTENASGPKDSEVKTTKALFCFDFDYTIPNKHTHNEMFDNFDIESSDDKWINDECLKFWDENRKACEDFIRGVLPLGEPAAWKKLFTTLVEDGHFLAIPSFNAFGKRLIPFYLRDVIGLDENFIRDHIKVVSFLPPKEEQNDKSKHIAQAKRELNLTDLPDDCVVLIDDSETNISAAQKAGHKTIHVKQNDASHINAAVELSKSMKNAEKKSALGEQGQALRFSR